MSDNETRDDIIAEMRGRTDLDGRDMVDNFSLDAEFGEYGGYDALKLIRAYADRLDAAWRREIEALKAAILARLTPLLVGAERQEAELRQMREALEIISRTELPPNCHTTESGEVFTFADGNRWLGRLRTVVALAKNALTAPAKEGEAAK